jgi:hypothetical protein
MHDYTSSSMASGLERSIACWHNEEQKAIIDAHIAELNKKCGNKVVTDV